MPVHLMSGLVARTATVLRNRLTAELALVDTDEADGITTPAIASGDIHEWDRQNVPKRPAVTIAGVSTMVATDYDTTAHSVDALHRLEIKFHCGLGEVAGQDAVTLSKVMHRYIQAADRIFNKYPTLQTVADPADFVTHASWAPGEQATYGPEADQSGSIIRTAIFPLAIRRIERQTT